jgi:hypothetical protein
MQEMINGNTTALCDDEYIFIFVVQGSVPEFTDGLAFRFDETRRMDRRKSVICPHCNGEFGSVNIQTKIEVFRCSLKSKVQTHKTRKCKTCFEVVGIRYA